MATFLTSRAISQTIRDTQATQAIPENLPPSDPTAGFRKHVQNRVSPSACPAGRKLRLEKLGSPNHSSSWDNAVYRSLQVARMFPIEPLHVGMSGTQVIRMWIDVLMINDDGRGLAGGHGHDRADDCDRDRDRSRGHDHARERLPQDCSLRTRNLSLHQ